MTTAAPYTAVIAKLKATSGVTDLVGQHIYPRRGPESVRTRNDSNTFAPYIVVRKPQGDNRTQLVNRRDTFRKPPLSIYCFAPTHIAASAVADAVVAAIDDGTTARTGSQTWGAYTVDHCNVTDTYDASTDPSLGDEVDFYCEAIDIQLFFNC